MQSLYFKSQKKINQKHFIGYNHLSFKIDKKTLNQINKCVVDLFNYNESKNTGGGGKFKNLKHITSFLNKTQFYHLKKNLDVSTKLEKIILNYLRKKKFITKFIKGIEFPPTIRIVHPNEPSKLKKKYKTSSLHCDTWTEEPKDVINLILYLEVNNKSSKVGILENNKFDRKIYKAYSNYYKKKFFLLSKKYFSILRNLEKKNYCKLKNENGQMMIFDGYTPHVTIRDEKNSHVRLSLDLRLRIKNPYKSINKWSSLNNYEKYWFLPGKKVENFSQRLKQEYSLIKKKMKNYKKIINYKNKVIEKLI